MGTNITSDHIAGCQTIVQAIKIDKITTAENTNSLLIVDKK
jgi:beta-lactamase superfamily II metal-dependent hydrolase